MQHAAVGRLERSIADEIIPGCVNIDNALDVLLALASLERARPQASAFEVLMRRSGKIGFAGPRAGGAGCREGCLELRFGAKPQINTGETLYPRRIMA